MFQIGGPTIIIFLIKRDRKLVKCEVFKTTLYKIVENRKILLEELSSLFSKLTLTKLDLSIFHIRRNIFRITFHAYLALFTFRTSQISTFQNHNQVNFLVTPIEHMSAKEYGILM